MQDPTEKLNTERRKALAETFSFIERFLPVRDRRIYEIGADRFFVSAFEMMRMGAASVDCTNIAPVKTEMIQGHNSIRFHLIDSGKSEFQPGSFDVVYGRAVLEHIHRPGEVAREVSRLLARGGMFYLDGGPMWTCRHGHHVWVDAPSGNRYQFAGQHPFEPWEHLLYAPSDMESRLVGRGVPREDAGLIIRHVYQSDDMCRLTPSEVVAAFNSVPELEAVPVRVAVGAEPPEVPGVANIDLRTGKLILVGRKLQKEDRRGDLAAFVEAGLNLLPGPRFIRG